jgi:hypothetical protein
MGEADDYDAPHRPTSRALLRQMYAMTGLLDPLFLPAMITAAAYVGTAPGECTAARAQLPRHVDPRGPPLTVNRTSGSPTWCRRRVRDPLAGSGPARGAEARDPSRTVIFNAMPGVSPRSRSPGRTRRRRWPIRWLSPSAAPHRIGR